MRVRGVLAVGTAVLALAACDQIAVNAPASNPRYFPNEDQYAARNGAIRVEVAGTTLGVPHDRFAEMVVADMRRGQPALPKPTFVTHGSRLTDPTYKVVVMFAPPTWLSADELCSHRPPPPAPRAQGSRLEMLAAFCRVHEASSEAHGSAPVSGVNDPKFAELVKQVALNLFPPVADTRINDGAPARH